ncbi:MAG: hypothetical protein JW836_15540 [Deltaproteobacteria bacterium]|nr:hypothetical protein [Deltaproteobacteria bacterium]
MAKKGKGRKGWLWWGVPILIIALVAVLGGYFLGMKHGRKDTEISAEPEKIGPEKEHPPPGLQKPDVSGNGPTVVFQQIVPPKYESVEDSCKRCEKDVQDFFAYLGTREYIRHILEGADPFEYFLSILARLSSKLPIPAGESADSAVLNSNIYHFFRVLDRKDIRFIREIIANERESLEMNIEMIYRWLIMEKRCPNPGRVRPTREALYHYAGFFVNTIGGRSYLFRRPLGLRLLGTYYSLLIIHESDKEGRNLYGIDPFAYIPALMKEITLYSDFRFQETYLEKLREIETYYLQRR